MLKGMFPSNQLVLWYSSYPANIYLKESKIIKALLSHAF
jgi:hypothetical protein